MGIKFFDVLFTFLEYAIFIEVMLSWVSQGRENRFTEILHIVTDPLMKPGKMIQEKLMPGLMIDFSPIVAFLIISILRRLVYMMFLAF